MVLAGACTAGCGEEGALPLVWLGKGGVQAPASNAGAIFWIDAEVNGKAHSTVIVDTGAPVTMLNPAAFDGQIAEGDGRAATLSLGGVTVWKAPVIGYSQALTLAPTGGYYGGIVGFTLFGQFSTSFNYRDHAVTFGKASVPAGVDASISVAFQVEGGGRARIPDGAVVGFPASRVLLPVTIEGEPHTLLLDTGASWIGLDSALFAKLTSDGRATLMDEARLESGPTSASIARLHSVAALGMEVSRPVAASGSGIDELLATISDEVGRKVDGMLGAPFLREFFVVVDYPNGKLELRRYENRSHIRDDYQRVGIELRAEIGSRSNSYFVNKVIPGTDAAAQKVALDEPIVSIDNRSLDRLDPVEVDGMLLGTPRTTKMIEFEDRTLGIRVDDLLPLP